MVFQFKIHFKISNTKGEITLIWNLDTASVKIKQNILRIERAIWKNKFVGFLYGCEALEITRITVFGEITLIWESIGFRGVSFKSA